MPTNCYAALLFLERVHGYMRINCDSGLRGPWHYIMDAKLDLEEELSRERGREMREAIERFAVAKTG
jgi:hypothetical protein